MFVLGPVVSPLSARQYFTHPETIEYLRNLFLDIRYPLPLVFASNPYPNVVNGSLWTLPIEVFMYLLVMVAGIAKCLSFRGCTVIALSFAWLHFAVPSTVFTDNGVVLHVMLYNELTRLGLLYFTGASFVFASDSWIKSKDTFWLMTVGFLLFAQSSIAEVASIIALPVIVLTAANFHSRVSEAVTRFGDMSYGVYVYAFPVQQATAMVLGQHPSPVLLALISLPITLALSFLSWHVIENPALKLKTYLPRVDKRGASAKAG